MVQTHTTSDIYLVATFLAKGASLVGSPDRTDPRRVKFTLEGENLDTVFTDWMNGSVEGNLVKFADSLRKIRLELFSNER